MEATPVRNYEAIEAEFINGVRAILGERWQAVVLALENMFAGEETEKNFAIMEQDVHDFFNKRNCKAREYKHELEEVLLQDTSELLFLDIRDGSISQISQTLINFYTLCSGEKFEEARSLYRDQKTHAAANEVVAELETRLQTSFAEPRHGAGQSESAMPAVSELTEEEAADGWEVVTKRSGRR